MLVRKALLDFLVPRRIFSERGGRAVALGYGFGCVLWDLRFGFRASGSQRGFYINGCK